MVGTEQDDHELSLRLLAEASEIGTVTADSFLGNVYDTNNGVGWDIGKARCTGRGQRWLGAWVPDTTSESRTRSTPMQEGTAVGRGGQ